MEAAQDRVRRRYRDRVELAWMVVAFDRTKRLPSLEKLLKEPSASRKPQTWQEMKSLMKTLTKGGGRANG